MVMQFFFLNSDKTKLFAAFFSKNYDEELTLCFPSGGNLWLVFSKASIPNCTFETVLENHEPGLSYIFLIMPNVFEEILFPDFWKIS